MHVYTVLVFYFDPKQQCIYRFQYLINIIIIIIIVIVI
jgi:hypothetical protein